MPKRRRSSNLSFKQLSGRAAKLSPWLTILALGLSTGCSGRQIHPELRPDPSILIRKWALQTHGLYHLGERGVEFSNPLVYENSLIFGNQSVGLLSLYPTLNQKRWVLPIAGGVVSELTTDGSAIYFGGGDGFLYSVNFDTGRVNWRYEVKNPVISKPTVSEGRVFITTSDDTVYAFDAGTGKWLWHYRRRTSSPATIYGASAPLVDGNEVIAGLSDGFLVSLSREEGQLKWERKLHTGVRFTDINAHPVLEEGIIYVPAYDGSLYALRRQGGDVLWQFDSGGSKDVVLEDDKLYLPSSDGFIYALQKSNAKILWKFELDHGTPTRLAMTQKFLVVGSSDRYLYVLDKITGKGVYRFNVGYGSGFYSSPAYDPKSNRLYVLSNAGNLYSFAFSTHQSKARKRGSVDFFSFGAGS